MSLLYVIAKIVNRWKMCPKAMQDNPRHHCAADPVLTGELALAHASSCPPSPSFNHLVVRKLGFGVDHPNWIPGRAVKASPLGFLVAHVIKMASQEHMVRIAAKRSIAFVANHLSDWDVSVEYSPRIAMSSNVSSTCGEKAIPGWPRSGSPKPAPMWSSTLVYLLPESLFCIFGRMEALASTATESLPSDLRRRNLNWLIALVTFSDMWGMVVVHFWSLLNRFRGAAPQVATNNAGAFACLYYIRNHYNQAEKQRKVVCFA